MKSTKKQSPICLQFFYSVYPFLRTPSPPASWRIRPRHEQMWLFEETP